MTFKISKPQPLLVFECFFNTLVLLGRQLSSAVQSQEVMPTELRPGKLSTEMCLR